MTKAKPTHMVNPLSVMQDNEKVVCEIRRHPIGVLGMFLAGSALLIAVAIMAFLVLPGILNGASRSQQMTIGLLIFFISAGLVTVFLYFANQIYYGNHWIVTDDSLTQIIQTSLFDKHSSQLSLANLEDISAEQNTFFGRVFHYGVISAETAGAADKFILTYCPTPNLYARKILNAREQFEQGRRPKSPDETSTVDSYNVPFGDD